RDIFQHPHPTLEHHVAGGVVVRKEYDKLHFTYLVHDRLKMAQKPSAVKLEIPGKTVLPDYDGIMEVYRKNPPIMPWNQHEQVAIFDASQIHQPVFVRPRKNGDRMTCFGLKGSKKIKELLIEAKIPRSERDRYPIVVMDGRIIWIPGIRRSDFAPV